MMAGCIHFAPEGRRLMALSQHHQKRARTFCPGMLSMRLALDLRATDRGATQRDLSWLLTTGQKKDAETVGLRTGPDSFSREECPSREIGIATADNDLVGRGGVQPFADVADHVVKTVVGGGAATTNGFRVRTAVGATRADNLSCIERANRI